MVRLLLCYLAIVTLARATTIYLPTSAAPPVPAREFRGAWVATVHNIDWPSRPGLTTAQQQAELAAILDRAQQLKLNVVIFQVRPACDALYASKIEPWSEFLTGVMGKAPNPWWDPLDFAVTEAHKRGLKLHAWFNPFRARHNTAFSAISRNHVSKTRPGIVKTYGTYLWLDPGLQEVQDYSMRVIMDVVSRYDVDGIHIDDYFYPYRETNSVGQIIPFPDWTSWNSYLKRGGKLAKEDWRRDNVNRFVARMSRDVKAAKPWLQVGISPFGIYRPGFPQQIRGFDQYASIYADPRAWLQAGSLDYLAPQLYWRIEPPAQSFSTLLKWWAENNPKRRLIVPGLNTSSVAVSRTNAEMGRGWPAAEILKQIEISRMQDGCAGHIHWNMGALIKNKSGIADDLARTAYTQMALAPALSDRRGKVTIPEVKVRIARSQTRLDWSAPERVEVSFWLLQIRRGSEWRSEVLPRGKSSFEINGVPDMISIRAIDRYGALGPATMVQKTVRN